jgi:hypothetical protein
MPGDSIQDQQGQVATINNAGSANTPGWTLTINKDGSGSLVYDGRNGASLASYQDETFVAGTFDSVQLASLLTQIGDVSTIPDHHCQKADPDDAITTMSYQGKTSGDLTCLSEGDQQVFLELQQLVLDFEKEFPGDDNGGQPSFSLVIPATQQRFCNQVGVLKLLGNCRYQISNTNIIQPHAASFQATRNGTGEYKSNGSFWIYNAGPGSLKITH